MLPCAAVEALDELEDELFIITVEAEAEAEPRCLRDGAELGEEACVARGEGIQSAAAKVGGERKIGELALRRGARAALAFHEGFHDGLGGRVHVDSGRARRRQDNPPREDGLRLVPSCDEPLAALVEYFLLHFLDDPDPRAVIAYKKKIALGDGSFGVRLDGEAEGKVARLGKRAGIVEFAVAVEVGQKLECIA